MNINNIVIWIIPIGKKVYLTFSLLKYKIKKENLPEMRKNKIENLLKRITYITK